MIFVQRSAVPPSLDPNDPTSAGSREIADFLKAYRATGAIPASGAFKAYAGEDVRQALIDLFHGKCAYCETTIVGASQSDIEHYRPKGGVKEADDASVDHPGYWWLAMDWENLLLSCMHCNQGRRQLIVDDDMSEEDIKKAIVENDLQTTGKRNAFPTEDGKWATSPDDDHDDETALLLNPTTTDPENLIEWVLDARLPTLKGRAGNKSVKSTVDCLGLNRRYLAEHREKALRGLRAQGDMIRRAVDRIATAPSDAIAQLHFNAAAEMLGALAEYTTADKDFAGLARAFYGRMEAVVAGALPEDSTGQGR